MGKSNYGVPAASWIGGGGGYVTAYSHAKDVSSASSLTAVEAAAVTLETSVSSALFAVVTGIMGAPAVTTLSASYATVTGSIF